MILVKECKKEEEALLLKDRLLKSGIEAYLNGVNSVYENPKVPTGLAVAVRDEFFEAAIQVLRKVEAEQNQEAASGPACPNCGAPPLGARDLFKGHFFKLSRSLLKGKNQKSAGRSSAYRICRACGLEFA